MAAEYTVAKFLGSWTPAAISTPSSPNYTVGASATYKTVQSAINAAINAGGSTRKYILVNPGTYNEMIFVPSGTPITLYGTGDASAVKIQIATSALQTGSAYKSMVGTNFTTDGQSWVNSCASKSAIGTTCSAAFVIKNTGFEAKNLTITNSRVESGSGTDQAVAVYTTADQVHFDNVRMYGNQDTLWIDGAGKRFYSENCYVEGDVDFIFGAGTGVLDNCQINYTAARGKNGSTIGAPSTQASNYGILINGGSITGSNGASGVAFARQWPQSSLSSPIGKMIIRGANITLSVDTSRPWRDWDSSHPANYGSSSSPNLGEYLNTGSGAAK
ncbi:putative acyl-CoA thioester hydrolase [Viridibacterium curvum]|uniref:Pectinesterase n=1 Tax=Viridibacterium curvum TaxID=1101404 RepID=A0ABP9Q8E8_9RHOO